MKTTGYTGPLRACAQLAVFLAIYLSSGHAWADSYAICNEDVCGEPMESASKVCAAHAQARVDFSQGNPADRNKWTHYFDLQVPDERTIAPNTCVLPAGTCRFKLIAEDGFIEDNAKNLRQCSQVVDIKPPQSPQPDCCFGNPIYPARGVKREELDLGLAIGAARLRLSYDNTAKIPLDAGTFPAADPSPRVLGTLWSSSLHRALLIQAAGHGALVSRGDGRVVAFSGNGANAFAASDDSKDLLHFVTGGNSYRYINGGDSSQETYNLAGQLINIAWTSGDSVALTYSNGPTADAPAAGYLLRAQDNRGRSVNFQYNLVGRLVRITDAASQPIDFGYDAEGNLHTVTWADGATRSFAYENSAHPWALTGVIDERSIRKSTFGYDQEGRATSTAYAGGVNQFVVNYSVPPQISFSDRNDPITFITYRTHKWTAPQGMTLTTPSGGQIALGMTEINGKVHLTSQSQPAGSGSAAGSMSQGFDANGNLARRDDYNGTRTCYSHDLARNLERARIEGLGTTTNCGSVTPPNAALPAGARKTSTRWHPHHARATQTAEPGRLITHVFNGQPDPFNDNAIAACAPASALLPDGKPIAVLCKQVEQATTDTNGAKGTEVAGVPPTAFDPHYANVTLLLHGDGTNGATSFVDASNLHQVPSEVASPVVIDTSSAKFGSGASNFTGGYLRYPASPAFDMGAGDFTVEAWVKFNSAAMGARVGLFGQSDSVGQNGTFGFSKTTSNVLAMGLTTNTGTYGFTGSTPVAANTWYHLALVRSGNTLTFYRNGIAELTGAVSGAIPVRTTQFGVGVAGEYTGVYGTEWGTRMMGWLDELRITKGVARYTAAFTPPTEPFAETATGSPGRPSGIDAKVQPRITRWTYNALGQKLTADGPRTDVEDVTRYEYYHDTTADHTLGDLKQVTDAAGNVTRYTKYNKHGQMLESVDANNAPTANTYDLRQRLKSTSMGGRTTTYDYDAAGQLKKLTLPDASWIGFDYDDAHRQIAVYDHKGNRTDYVLDNAGKRIGESTKDPGGALKRQLSRSIDALGRVQQTTGRE